MIKPTTFSATLREKRQLTHNVFEFIFTTQQTDFTYQAGHFVMLTFEHENKPEQRAYSISSRPQPNTFELCIKLIPDGKGSTFLKNSKVGDTINFKGPFGMFTIKPDNQEDLLLIGTGTGIAPIKSIAQDLLTKNDTRNLQIIFGVRFPSDVFYQETFQQLTQSHPNLQVIITCSQPENDPQAQPWNGSTGRVTTFLTPKVLENKNQHIYICGNNQMVKDIRNQALEADIPKQNIHLENFG